MPFKCWHLNNFLYMEQELFLPGVLLLNSGHSNGNHSFQPISNSHVIQKLFAQNFVDNLINYQYSWTNNYLPNTQPPPPPPLASDDMVPKAPPLPPPVASDNHLSEEEKVFDAQFKEWEEKFKAWKEENKNHPDKVKY